MITGLDLIRRQFLALFIKRFHYARRSRKGLVAQVTASVCPLKYLLVVEIRDAPVWERRREAVKEEEQVAFKER